MLHVHPVAEERQAAEQDHAEHVGDRRGSAVPPPGTARRGGQRDDDRGVAEVLGGPSTRGGQSVAGERLGAERSSAGLVRRELLHAASVLRRELLRPGLPAERVRHGRGSSRSRLAGAGVSVALGGSASSGSGSGATGAESAGSGANR